MGGPGELKSEREIWKIPAYRLHTFIQKREISVKELILSFLKRTEEVEEKVRAFLTLRKEEALKEAEEKDKIIKKLKKLPPLFGIPVGVKDNICLKGEEVTCGSRILKGFYAPYEATVVRKLKEAGAIILGKTNLDEFAMGSSTENSAFFPTHNPWDKKVVPGGSSGGSAAAVAAGEVPLALGSDTGGSIRQPASFCGVVGLKPTYGRVSRYGLVAFASSLDQIGPLGKNVADTGLLLQVIGGKDELDSTSVGFLLPDYLKFLSLPIEGLKIGLPREYFVPGIDQEVREKVLRVAEKLKEEGVRVEEISLPHTEYAIGTYYLICTAEASSNLARYDGVQYGLRIKGVKDIIELYKETRREGFGKEVKRRIMLGTYVLSKGYYEAYYGKAQKVRTLIREDFNRAFEKVDVILTPTSPTPPFRLGERIDDPLQMYLSDIFTISANLSGICGISIPCGFTKEGLPIGAQFLGKPFEEETILKVAYHYEKETSWHKRWPKI